MTKKTFLIGLSVALAVFLTLFTLVTVNSGFYDLQISKLLVTTLAPNQRYATSIFGRIFETLGEQPFYLLIQLCFISLIVILLRKKKTPLVIIGIVGLFGLSIATGFFALHRIEAYIARYQENDSVWTHLFSPLPFCLNLFGGMLISLLLFFSLRKFLSSLDEKSLLRLILVFLVAVIASQVLVQLVIKNIFHRTRYRAINVNPALSFLPWYQINEVPTELGNNITDDFRSFPSGHTCSMATSFIMMLIPIYFPKLQTKIGWSICILVPVIGTFLIALARIMMGAHYLSDVTCGAFIPLFFIWCAYFVERKISKEPSFKTLVKV
ncbi:MAG: phosphatase PAP2 family protein [Bacilli bacterium]|jgi:membrane-associated phospholipid phosphatase